MLVVPFQVQVGLGAGFVVFGGVGAAQHVPEGGAGVEPHFQDVVALDVVRRVFGAQDVFGAHAAPGLDAALLHDVGGLVDDFHRARVQLVRVFVQKEGDGHAPGALAADDPVGPARDHVAQAHLAVGGVKAGVFNGPQRGGAQGFGRLFLGEHAFAFVHAHKPLRGGAVDNGRFVSPAVRVAVGDGLGGQHAACVAQGVDDARAGFPDVQPAKQGQGVHVFAVGLYGVEDFIGLHPVGDAAVEVVHAVGGG